jgi:hypothetical protein
VIKFLKLLGAVGPGLAQAGLALNPLTQTTDLTFMCPSGFY